MGSPLYTELLERAAEDVEAGGPAWTILSAHVAPGRGDAIALRLMAAVHRLVLNGKAPALAQHYPSVDGGRGVSGAWEAFRGVLEERGSDLRSLVSLPCQTNEVGRCAPLAFGFLEVVAESGLPLRLLEPGASAGLNLRWDHSATEAGESSGVTPEGRSLSAASGRTRPRGRRRSRWSRAVAATCGRSTPRAWRITSLCAPPSGPTRSAGSSV